MTGIDACLNHFASPAYVIQIIAMFIGRIVNTKDLPIEFSGALEIQSQ
jgi:formate hydrogenlyase subunit 4